MGFLRRVINRMVTLFELYYCILEITILLQWVNCGEEIRKQESGGSLNISFN
jgi:hypothetical protein